MPGEPATLSDLDILLALNGDYVRSVQNSDVARFDQILASEFFCSNPDGTLVDRAGFLTQTARRYEAQTRLQAASALFGPSKKEERSREEVAVILRFASSMLRDIEALNAGADQTVLANPMITNDLTALARSFSGDRARDAFGALDKALMALERNAGVKVVAEWLAVQI